MTRPKTSPRRPAKRKTDVRPGTGPRHPNPAKKRQRDIGLLITQLRRVSTTDLVAVLCARLIQAGRSDLAGIISSHVSAQIPAGVNRG